MNLFDPGITPELFSDRGVAWVKAVFEICNQGISSFGVLALAAIAVWQNIVSKARLDERLDRQAARIEANHQAITTVALAVPTPPAEPPQA